MIESLRVSEAELIFHADRIARNVDAATEMEGEHLEDLQAGYRAAARFCAILRRYQEGRARHRGLLE